MILLVIGFVLWKRRSKNVKSDGSTRAKNPPSYDSKPYDYLDQFVDDNLPQVETHNNSKTRLPKGETNNSKTNRLSSAEIFETSENGAFIIDSHVDPKQLPSNLQKVVVIHPYSSGQDDELVLKVGMVLIVRKRFDDGWALGVTSESGVQGVFPVDFTQDMDDYLNSDSSQLVHADGRKPKDRSSSVLDFKSTLATKLQKYEPK